MKRRDLLAGIAVSAAVADQPLEAQQAGMESLYIPKAHRVEDRVLLHDFMDEFSFVDLVTATPTVRVTHIPTLLDRSAGAYGTLFGHIARNNPQHQNFDGRQSAVLVFRGPHAYISPSWYNTPQAVPTWNFAVVHASGKLKSITDKQALHGLLGRLIRKFENRYGGSTYDFEKLPDSYTSGMLGNIVGFEMQIDSLEGKFKLGQERSQEDQAGMLEHLGRAKQERSIRDFTASFYDRLKKAAAAKSPA